jgi:selenocysteine-specific elongation factor
LLEAVAAGNLQRIANLLAARDGGALSAAEAARLSRLSREEIRALLKGFETVSPDVLAAPEAVATASEAYLGHLAEAHRAAPYRAWLPALALRGRFARTTARDLIEHVERRLAASGEIRVRGGQVALSTHDPLASLPPSALAHLHDLERAVRQGGASPPDLGAQAAAGSEGAALVELLIDLGSLVALRNHALRQTLFFHIEALDEALANLRLAFPPPTEFTTGAARAALCTSRKFIVPILEFLDSRGETVREGDLRRIV